METPEFFQEGNMYIKLKSSNLPAGTFRERARTDFEPKQESRSTLFEWDAMTTPTANAENLKQCPSYAASTKNDATEGQLSEACKICIKLAREVEEIMSGHND